MNKFIAIGALALSLAGCGAPASIDKTQSATPTMNLEVDGQTVLTSLHPFYSSNILYVPARVLLEYYRCELKWNNSLKTLTLTDENNTNILLTGNEDMESPAILRNGHLYIPADSLNSLSGAEVQLNTANTVLMVTSGSVSTTVRVPREPLALADGNNEVKLYAALKEGETYKGYILEVNGERHTFPWEGPRLPMNPPQLYYADIDEDGQAEAIVVLTNGTGTGIVAQELHVIKPQQWQEITVPTAEQAVAANVTTSVTKNKDELLLSLELKGSTPSSVSLALPGLGENVDDNQQPGMGAVTYYTVEAGKLKAETSVNLGFFSIGTLKLVYKPRGIGMELETLEFVPNEEYAAYVQPGK
ncbi:stalk domain-containing protein [Paenibacillus monticola]|uniref:Copper amine oxidase-like N-terminal domain-containing protein n=1 Tax=Paenibacillus monticola TaxID=2666075 RepID=A0A7X2L0X0_9BACL|nr:stalk domain-containing protein [Paenibacillus monticola]MRN51726.1 hypothetical protein [Paenibacillus monticola]